MSGADDNPARLCIEAATAAEPVEPGLHPLGLGTDRDGLLYVPDGDGPYPLLVVFHGATMHARQMARPLVAAADDVAIALLLPDSRGQTWDVLMGGYGDDIAFVNRALVETLRRCPIDIDAVSVAGVSDGASYALSLGLANGDVIRRVIAWSPGFVAPPTLVGQPPVFLSHGVHDTILPIDVCGRPIAAGLRNSGYEIDYVEFDGGHEMPDPVVRRAFVWLRS